MLDDIKITSDNDRYGVLGKKIYEYCVTFLEKI